MKKVMSLEKIFPDFEKNWYAEAESFGTTGLFIKDQLIFQPVDALSHSMLILEGLVKVYRCSPDGAEYFMYYMRPGEACAFSLPQNDRRHKMKIKARAAADSVILQVPLPVTNGWMHKYPCWHQFVFETYQKALDGLLRAIDHVAFQHMDERLNAYLQTQKEFMGSQLHLTHTEIAHDLNTSREVISRLLKKMECAGQVRIHRNNLEVV